MLTLKNERVVYFDVDDTLIMHRPVKKGDKYVDVLDPLGGKDIRVVINQPILRLLLEEAHRGACVVVWSRGGWQWAKHVVNALGIEDSVNMVQSKPFVYFDDKDIDNWLLHRVYMTPETHYKNKG